MMVYRVFILRIITLVCCLWSFIPASLAKDTPLLETREFSKPSMPWRPIPLWFWNNTRIVEASMIEQFHQMIEKDGYGGCAILPFGAGFRPDYLSEEYLRLYGVVLNEAHSLGAHLSIYDEYGFPSGSMGAINGSGVTTFMNNHPNHTVKRLDKVEFRVSSGATFDRQLPLQGRLMSLVAWNVNTKEIIPLRDYYDEASGRLTWTAPKESGWHVMMCQCVKDGDPNVDYLSPEAVKLFVQDTHEVYYNRFSNHFGGTIISTFLTSLRCTERRGVCGLTTLTNRLNSVMVFLRRLSILPCGMILAREPRLQGICFSDCIRRFTAKVL